MKKITVIGKHKFNTYPTSPIQGFHMEILHIQMFAKSDYNKKCVCVGLSVLMINYPDSVYKVAEKG